MKKIFFIGLISGLIMLVISMVVSPVINGTFPELVSEYSNTNVMRAFNDPLMQIYFFVPFVSGIILTFIWTKVRGVIKGSTDVKKGIRFGFWYFLFSLPGMLMSYSCFQVSLTMVISWWVIIWLQGIAVGIINAKYNK